MSNFIAHRKGPGRFFDHVYDPLYAMSGTRDLWRNNVKSLAISGQVQIYPVYKTMFTDLPWRPRNYFIRQRNALPFDNRRISDIPEHCNQNSRQLKGTGTCVGGVDRAKYFNIPLGNTKTISLHLDMKAAECKCYPEGNAADKNSIRTPPQKTVGMQTMYRETSAQTRPWLPPAKIADGELETPEIVYVAEMMRDDPEGSMPGIYEAEMVARARKRRLWEKSLPAIATFEEWNHRKLALEAFEWEEWIGRENKIDYCQRLRLGIVQQMMMNRKEKKRAQCALSVAKKTEELEKRKAQQLEQLRNKYRRRIKRYTNEHKGITTKYRPSDVITEHIDRSSNLYAPQTRFGVHPKHRHFMAHKTQFQARLDNLRNAPQNPINCKAFLTDHIDLSKPKGRVTEVQRGLNTDKALRELYEGLLLLRSRNEDKRDSPNCIQHVRLSHSPEYRTPDDSERGDKNEHVYQMAVYIQQMIKGRAIQNEIYAGRDKCRELIDEFRTTHQLSEICVLNAQADVPNKLTEDRKYAHYQQRRLAAILRAEAQIMEMADQAKGTTMAFALELLETEMSRLSDQRNAHALCMLAENERYRREATEAGYRQHGDNRRRTHDEIARNEQLVKHNTIVEYLEKVLTDCIDKMAEKSAREQIRDLVRKIDEEAEDPTPLRVVTGILNRFVLPDVFTHIARENHLADVHESLFGKVPDMISEHKRLRMNRFLAEAVTPRNDEDNASVLSSLDSDEDPAHHEALRCVERAIGKAFQGTRDFVGTGEHGILDEIIDSVISDEREPRSQLTEIVTDLSEQLWQAVEESEINVCKTTTSVESVKEKSELDLLIQKIPTVPKDAIRTSVWRLDDDEIIDVLENRSADDEDYLSVHSDGDIDGEVPSDSVVSI